MKDLYKRFRKKYKLPDHFTPNREKDPTGMWDRFLDRTIDRVSSGKEVYELQGNVLTVFVIESVTKEPLKVDIYVGDEIFYYIGYNIPEGHLPEYDTKCKLLELVRTLKEGL